MPLAKSAQRQAGSTAPFRADRQDRTRQSAAAVRHKAAAGKYAHLKPPPASLGSFRYQGKVSSRAQVDAWIVGDDTRQTRLPEAGELNWIVARPSPHFDALGGCRFQKANTEAFEMCVDGGGGDRSEFLFPVIRNAPPEHGEFQARVLTMHRREAFWIKARNHNLHMRWALADRFKNRVNELIERLVMSVLLDLHINAETKLTQR